MNKISKKSKKSIKLNAILNSIKSLMTIFFPLITVSYLSRVLGKTGYGKFNYSVSIVVYFILIAGLGINTYAVREGAKVRNDREKEEQLDSEIFTLNIISTFISYGLLFVLLFFSKGLQPYRSLILIISINIIFLTLGTDWVNSIYEDFLYLTFRYIVVQIVSIVAILLFIRTENDLIKYTWIYLFSQTGANIANIFYVRRYVKLRLVFSRNVFKHFVPTLILFGSTIAVRIYTNSDITILGIIKGDAVVGIYSIASKIYVGAKQIANAATVVTIPRLATYIGQNKKREYMVLLNNILNLLVSVTIPLFTGLFMVSEQVIMIIGGQSYIEGARTLRIFCFASIFSILSYYFVQCILIPNGKEKYYLFTTVTASIVNVVGNFLIIPFLSHVGAALTTLVSELFTMVLCILFSRDLHESSVKKNTITSTMLASGAVVCICIVVGVVVRNTVISVVIDVALSVVASVTIMYIMKNSYVTDIIDLLLKKIKMLRKDR